MTTKPNTSIESIVEEFKEQFEAYQTTSNMPYPLLVDWLRKTLKAERERVGEAIELLACRVDARKVGAVGCEIRRLKKALNNQDKV